MYKKYDRVFYAMAAIGFAYSLATTNNTWLFITAICYGIWIMGLIGRATSGEVQKDGKG